MKNVKSPAIICGCTAQFVSDIVGHQRQNFSRRNSNCTQQQTNLTLIYGLRPVNRGIKHDFPFINICKVPMEVLKTEGEAQGLHHSRGTLRMLMNDKIMFDRYYCINSANFCENEENIGALYFITSSNFPTRVCF